MKGRFFLAVVLVGFSTRPNFGQDYDAIAKTLSRQFDGRVKMASSPVLWLPLLWPKGCPPEEGSPSDTGAVVVDVPREEISDGANVSTTAVYIEQIIDHIHQNYPGEVTDQQLRDAAVNGMLQSLDRHSYLIPPSAQEVSRSSYENRSAFAGIGAGFLAKEEGQYALIDYTIPDSPAYLAGLRHGDILLAIDGVDVKAMTLEQVVQQLIGEESTQVQLKVLKSGLVRASMEVILKREIYHIPNIYYEMATIDVGYVDMRGFHSGAETEFRGALDDLKQKGMKRLIVDMRGNPGGYLNSAVEMARLFLLKDQIVVSEKYKDQSRSTNFLAFKDGDYATLPLIILIDGGSASASEVFAGALSDHGRALLVGSESYGKGIVQYMNEGFPESGYTVKMTQARYHFASGKTVGYPNEGENGLLPDIKVEVNDATKKKINHDRILRMMRQPLENPNPDQELRAAVRYFYAQASK